MRELDDPASCYSGSNVLITGGLGFLGSNLAFALGAVGAKVTLVDSLLPQYGGNPRNIEGIEGDVSVSYTDIRDSYAMAYLIGKHDFIFNFAGQVSHRDSIDDPITDLEINTSASLQLLELVRKNNPGARVIYAGTRQVYGRPHYLPVDEAHPLNPTDANGISNLAAEMYHRMYAKLHGIRATSLRMTNTYGPRQRLSGTTQAFVPIFIRKAFEDETITIFGDGTQRRDFVYVTDAVDAFLRAGLAADAVGMVMNLGHPEPMSLRNFAELLCEVTGTGRVALAPWPPDYERIDIGDYYGSFEMAREILGWEPRIGVREGLEMTVDYYRRRIADYV